MVILVVAILKTIPHKEPTKTDFGCRMSVVSHGLTVRIWGGREPHNMAVDKGPGIPCFDLHRSHQPLHDTTEIRNPTPEIRFCCTLRLCFLDEIFTGWRWRRFPPLWPPPSRIP